MKAMMSVAPGGPETLEITEVDTPNPGVGQILIAVKAAGVNFPETLIIRDMYQFKPPRPFAPGSEVAGVVAAVGDDVEEISVGDRVLAAGFAGGFATHFIADSDKVHKIPDAMPFDEAASFLMTFGTSHYALANRADAQTGESLLILGAAGGVGSAAIELGKAMGLRVVAGVSSPEKAEFCRELGADDAIVYPRSDMDRAAQKALSSEIKAKCGGEGANIVYDAVGGQYAEPALRSVAWDGRYLVVGFPAGIPSIPLNLTLLKSCQIVGVFWGAFTMRDPKRNAENISELFKLYESKKIRPRVTARFPLADAARALEMLEGRNATGKIVLTVD